MVTVIVPIYNSEKTLPKCIDSIQRQTYKEMEIILIDDGSTDRSGSICDQCAKDDERIIVCHKSNEGLLKARKDGVLMASGDFVTFVDSDDWIEPEMYESLVKKILDTDSDIVSSGVIRDYVESGCSVTVCDNYEEGLYDNPEETIYPSMLWNEQMYTLGIIHNAVTKLYKRSILQEVLEDVDTDIFYGEDCLLCMSYILKAKRVYISHQAYYHYRIHDGSMCDRPTPKLLNNSYLLYSELKRIFMRQDCAEVLMRQLKYYILEVIEKNNLRQLFDIDLNQHCAWSFSHDMSMFDKRYILYGAGAYGQALYRLLKRLGKEKNMSAWIDKKYLEKNIVYENKILAPNKIAELDYDYIVVAVMKEKTADSIRKELAGQYDVKPHQIIWKEAVRESIYKDCAF